MSSNTRPIAVLISDIHFTPTNLDVASNALQMAISTAEILGVGLVIAGDLHDTKAIVRAEVMNRLIHILTSTKVYIHILVGNHDLINEKDTKHGLNYLHKLPNVYVVDEPYTIHNDLHLIPYTSNIEALKESIEITPTHKTIIMHQGVKGAWMGDYIQDKTSIDPELLKYHKVISGHYHKHQVVGTVTYIGSPYTITFGEANDGPKGFLVLNDDGSYEHVPTNLRKHVITHITERNIDDIKVESKPGDLHWFKISGTETFLNSINRIALGERLIGHSNYKLDLNPVEVDKPADEFSGLTNLEMLDKLIDMEPDNQEFKDSLKQLYKEWI